MTAIDEIKARIDIVDLVSETVKLRRTGKNYVGFCPFHPNSHTPAFAVFQESGTWRCFGQCNEGGDIFKFVMKKEGWDFPQALKYLANRAGVTLETLTPQAEAAAEEHERLHTLLEEAATFYRHQLLHTPAGQSALAYLHKRGLQDTIIETFGLGYAPATWEAAVQYLGGKGYTSDDLLQAGLASERESSGLFDRFRNRITFPIRDAMGKMAGFGARMLDPQDSPKFLNSPQTVLFDKGRLLYGLDQARKAIRAQDQVVIVEGYLDVIALHQGGYQNTVSPMGTALTEDQLRLLKRYTRRIVLALDPDAAGQKATLRGLELARQTMDRADELAFDARGLLRHEARLQADLRVTTLPDGVDPDEIVNQDPAEWGRILEAAKPIVAHVMDTLAAGRDLEDAKVKSEVAGQVMPLIDDVADPVERDAYRQRLARMLKVDERVLSGAHSPASPGRRPRPRIEKIESEPRTNVATMGLYPLEGYCLGTLLHRPDLIYTIDRALQEAGLTRLTPEDFEYTGYQLILRLLQESLEQDQQEPQAYVMDHLPDPLVEVAHGLDTKLVNQESDADRLVEDLIRTVVQMRLNHLSQHMNELRYLLEEAQEAGEVKETPYQDLVLSQAQTRLLLDRAMRQVGAGNRQNTPTPPSGNHAR
jgi:DNA primase